MSVIKVTPHPARYVNEPEWYDEVEIDPEQQARLEQALIGSFFVRYDAVRRTYQPWQNPTAYEQRNLALCVSSAIGVKPVYDRKNSCYAMDGWTIAGSTVISDTFRMDNMGMLEPVFNAQEENGYYPDDWVTIHYRPERYDERLVLNLCNIIQSRNPLIAQALSLKDEVQIIVDETPAFGIPLNAFSFESIEACVFLLQQAARMALQTSKARMQPCDMSNPKFQMRSWLLRLGFVGDEYARPRATLLKNLEGDAAFFNAESKQKAATKRRAQRLAI